MHFGKTLEARQYPPWSPFYLDYSFLKEILEREEEEYDAVHCLVEHGGAIAITDGNNSVDHSVSASSNSFLTLANPNHHPTTNEFLAYLQVQMEKILLFVLQESGRIAIELAEMRNVAAEAQTEEQLAANYEGYKEIGLHLLRLVQFIDLNVTGLRKIVKKHDRRMKAKISSSFWAAGRSRLRGSRLVDPLLLQDETMGALALILESRMEELRHRIQQFHEEALLLRSAPQTLRKEHARTHSAPSLPASTSIPAVITQSGGGGGRTASLTPPPSPPAFRTSKPTLATPPRPPQASELDSNRIGKAQSITKHSSYQRLYPPPSPTSASTLMGLPDPILIQIESARRRLKQTNDFVKLLAAPLMIADVSPARESGDEAEEDDMMVSLQEQQARRSRISNILNLLSTFGYMTNYYVVVPTSGTYAGKLGGDPAMAAMIIGMTPIAALFSTILFSWWTSYSYKSALVFASCCSLTGNICYALGMPCDSLTLVMVGRLLNGFGSARSINRRYIADTFSRQERTAASALFVTAGALGMAAGPAIAAFLTLVAPGDEVNLYWQVENSPGWFMMVLWAAYLVTLILYFQDPPRKKAGPPSTELTGEQKPLLTTNGGGSNENSIQATLSVRVSKQSLFRNVPVMMTFHIYFVLKLILECVLSSSAILTGFYFEWEARVAGIYLASISLLMLPANMVVAYLSKRYDDRELIMVLQAVMVAGCLGVMQYSATYSVAQYVIGSVVLFISTNALEGPNMSLLSKTIPTSWSRGIFNVGLLATEAGTAGRAVGDVLLSAFGKGGLGHLLNRTFGSFAVLSGATLALSWWMYDFLEPMERDD